MLSFVLQLQDNTVVVRPSMVKVKADPKLSGMQSLSSLEIVSTRYSGKLFVLLHFGCKYLVFLHIWILLFGDFVSVYCNPKATISLTYNCKSGWANVYAVSFAFQLMFKMWLLAFSIIKKWCVVIIRIGRRTFHLWINLKSVGCCMRFSVLA